MIVVIVKVLLSFDRERFSCRCDVTGAPLCQHVSVPHIRSSSTLTSSVIVIRHKLFSMLVTRQD